MSYGLAVWGGGTPPKSPSAFNTYSRVLPGLNFEECCREKYKPLKTRTVIALYTHLQTCSDLLYMATPDIVPDTTSRPPSINVREETVEHDGDENTINMLPKEIRSQTAKRNSRQPSPTG